MKTVFLSDIHIGTNAVTNLYQSSTDQANLKKILAYVKELYGRSGKVYANSGFLCANTPDQNGIPVSTFVEVDDTGTGSYVVSLVKTDYATGAFSVDKTLTC